MTYDSVKPVEETKGKTGEKNNDSKVDASGDGNGMFKVQHLYFFFFFCYWEYCEFF